jgi:hypothetical protein
MSYGIWKTVPKPDGTTEECWAIASDSHDCFTPRKFDTKQEADAVASIWRMTRHGNVQYDVRKME